MKHLFFLMQECAYLNLLDSGNPGSLYWQYVETAALMGSDLRGVNMDACRFELPPHKRV